MTALQVLQVHLRAAGTRGSSPSLHRDVPQLHRRHHRTREPNANINFSTLSLTPLMQHNGQRANAPTASIQTLTLIAGVAPAACASWPELRGGETSSRARKIQ